MSQRVARVIRPIGWIGICVALSAGCRDKALQRGPRADAGETPGGLTAQQAALVLAKVGDHEITLGEYASTLERMDQFDRLRYQTPERRRELLEQMIVVELLAAEARKRGLDKDPETQEAVRQILREAMLQEARKKARAPADIPEAEVRAYFEEHKAEFQEPERRRVAHIGVRDKAKADKLLAEAQKASPTRWGELVIEHSVDSPGKGAKVPVELAGDLGLVGPAGDGNAVNPKVPIEVQKAVFEIAKPGDVLDRVVQSQDGVWHIVRLVSKTDPHTRSYAEAERTIRVAIVQKGLQDLEKDLEAELRKQIPVQIDEAALSKVTVPPIGSAPPPPMDDGP